MFSLICPTLTSPSLQTLPQHDCTRKKLVHETYLSIYFNGAYKLWNDIKKYIFNQILIIFRFITLHQGYLIY